MPRTRLSLASKVAIVTGAGRGIGKTIALDLAELGAKVIVNYRSSKFEAEGVVSLIRDSGGEAKAVQADVSRHEDIVQLFESAKAAFDRIDIVLSNSGAEDFTPLLSVTPERFDEIFNINARAQFFVAQQAYKHLEQGGSVILTSSIAAGTRRPMHHSLYAGSKLAVQAFVRTLATDMGDKRIRVNAIAPGGITSDMFYHAAWRYIPHADANWSGKQMEDALAGITPLGRVGTPNDIANVVAFLASDESYWINGETIPISGGAPT